MSRKITIDKVEWPSSSSESESDEAINGNAADDEDFVPPAPPKGKKRFCVIGH